jgi:hypothetical protein
MQEVFTQFGGGDFETGIDRFSALDTETGLRILEQTQGSQQFDAMAEAMAAANDQSDPGLAQALRDMVGRGHTDLGMINTIVSDRNAKEQMALAREQLQFQRLQGMTDTVLKLLQEEFSLPDIMASPMVQAYMGDGFSGLAKQALPTIDNVVRARDMMNVDTKVSRYARSGTYTELSDNVKGDPDQRVATRTRQAFSQGGVLAAMAAPTNQRLSTLAVIKEDPELQEEFLRTLNDEQASAYQAWSNDPVVNVDQGWFNNPQLLDLVNTSFSTLGSHTIDSLRIGRETRLTKEATVQAVRTNLIGLEEAGFIAQGTAESFVSKLPAESIRFDAEGKIVLDEEGQRSLTNMFEGVELPPEDMVDIVADLDKSFNAATTNALVKKYLAGAFDRTRHALEQSDLEAALMKLADGTDLWVTEQMEDTHTDLSNVIADAAVVVPASDAFSTQTIKAKHLPTFARATQILVDTGMVSGEVIRPMLENAKILATPGQGSLFHAGPRAEEQRAKARQDLVNEIAIFRKAYWTDKMRQRVKGAASTSTGRAKQQYEDLLHLMDHGFFTTLSNLPRSEMISTLVSIDYQDRVFGADTYTYDIETTGTAIDVGKLNFNKLGDILKSVGTSSFAAVTPFKSRVGLVEVPLQDLVNELADDITRTEALSPNLQGLGTLGYNWSNRLNAAHNSAVQLLESTKQRQDLSRAIDGALYDFTSSNFQNYDLIFTSALSSDGTTLALDGASFKERYKEQTTAEGAAIVLIEYMERKLKLAPISEAEKLQLGNMLATQRRTVVNLVDNLEQSLKDLPDQALSQTWEATFGYEPTGQVTLIDLIMATTFRSPFAP